MEWISIFDHQPEDGQYVLIGYGFGVGIALWENGDWDTVGDNRRHYIFDGNKKLYSSAQATHWMYLPKPPEDDV